ncbi:MAG: hypothetical protein ABIH82_06400 [Candidatus Woesearchaeota archaeon]
MQDFNALGNIQFGTDFVLFSINPDIYPLNIVKKAALEFVNKACVILDGDPKRELLVEIRGDNLKQLAEEFNVLLLKQTD